MHLLTFQIADDLSSAGSLQSAYEQSCIGAALLNMTLPSENDTEQTDGEKLLKDIQAALCPSNCNNKGVCNNGTCHCNPGMYEIT